jgi:Serine hydrolase (FSH1)
MRLIIAFSLVLSACTSQPNLALLQQKTQAKAMLLVDIASHGYVIRTYQRLLDNSAPINVYIEGDGFAYMNKWQASIDPTPKQAIGLMLALADNSANVVYMARPCQYTLKQSAACQVSDWTDKRFSEEMIAVINDALSQVKPDNFSQKIAFIGYSGGAAVAALLAARRHDIISLRTVAGNLNHQAVNTLHHVSPMPQSLNAIDVTSHIKLIPQIHFVGDKDTVIPKVIAQQFANKVGQCAQISVVPNANHQEGWQALWPQLLQKIPQCQ